MQISHLKLKAFSIKYFFRGKETLSFRHKLYLNPAKHAYEYSEANYIHTEVIKPNVNLCVAML